MVDPVLESLLETETGDMIKNTHFDNYHSKKGSWTNVFLKNWIYLINIDKKKMPSLAKPKQHNSSI